MKRIPFLLLITIALTVVLQQAGAQKSKAKPAGTAARPAIKIPEIATTLGRSALYSGPVSKRTFDSLVRQGIHLNGEGTIQGFNFTYAERMLYEDSAGNPLRTTDYLSEYCLGDTLSPGITAGLFERTKPGDTAYFDQIKVMLPSGSEARGKAMKFYIVPAPRSTR